MLYNCTYLNGSSMIVATTIYIFFMFTLGNKFNKPFGLFNVTNLKHAKLIFSYSKQF